MSAKVFASVLLLRRFLLTRARVRRGEIADPFPCEYRDPVCSEAKMLEWVEGDIRAHVDALADIDRLRKLLRDEPRLVRGWVDHRENEVMQGYYLRSLEEQTLLVDRIVRRLALVGVLVLMAWVSLPVARDDVQMVRTGKPVAARVVRGARGGRNKAEPVAA